ncbi:hypothetical protein BB559_003822 [Furculomyces boomerangus]|uniref:t-SNARE coiled-coil homology domain-containing protein n=2 Tax=Harpellales TaxID=61421 RepID=A0A2T9YIL8_9FUNG|nr:hypothetical protein BB559_003822 [Furculomyces boomerangus]PWA02829.1 hypothetical protein BB558_001014 [Smittium angustum]
MSRDRYAELKATRKVSELVVNPSQLEKGLGDTPSVEMQKFYEKVYEIEKNIKELNIMINDVHKIQTKNLLSLETDDGKSMSKNKAKKLYDSTNNKIQDIRKLLKGMETYNNTTISDVGDEAVKRGRHAALAKKFTEAIVHYRAIEREFQMKFRLRIERQIRIVNPNVTDEEIREIIENESGDEYTKSLFKVGDKKKAKKVLREVSERNQDIKKIEKTIKELNELFQEMQLLVFKQQSLIDNIERAVDSTEQYTIKSLETVDNALEIKRESNRVSL